MLSLKEIEENIKLIQSTSAKNPSQLQSISQNLTELKKYFSGQFQEVEAIFKQIDLIGLNEMIVNSQFNVYNKENEVVFVKGGICSKYYFLIHGNVTIYNDDKNLSNSAKLLKTISGGVVFGHKVKDIFQYFGYTQSNSVLLISIEKTKFEEILDELKNRIVRNKIILLKKFIPYFRNSPEDDIEKAKDRFMKLEYNQNERILIDGEYDEFIYIIISGECVALKSIKKIKGMKEILTEQGLDAYTHIVLEKYSKLFI